MSDWRDPFAEDEAAQERADRRAERERRRREEEARESVGDRVREEMADEPPQPPAAPPPDSGEPPTTPAAPQVPTAPAAAQPPPPADEESFFDDLPDEPRPESSPPPPRSPSSGAINRRRAAALVGIGILIVAVVAIGVFLSRRGGEEAPVSEPAKNRKTIEVVVPEGYDRNQIAEVAKKEGLKGDYLEATESVKGFDLAKYGAEDAKNLEGLLFPATYELFKGAKVSDLVKKQLEAFEANLAEADIGSAKGSGYTPYEIVIVASMVEREIAVPEERELAASVIYNRLDEGTPLGIDATIRFEDQNYSGQIVQSRLDEDTPYNTRINSGLPPGPIGNPGLASLEAAASPAKTDFFYFVVKPGSCNEHTFVETEAEFAAAEQAYQDALLAEGGSPTEC
ncbi:MAG: endolytic transglycosylase MltG [Actinomycetota bacterium]|nr:endolytic transglycosylase MltG [Actinomycetota bacterium]